jgi:hypothetical protein
MNGELAMDGRWWWGRKREKTFLRRDATEKLRKGSQGKGRYWAYERRARCEDSGGRVVRENDPFSRQSQPLYSPAIFRSNVYWRSLPVPHPPNIRQMLIKIQAFLKEG